MITVSLCMIVRDEEDVLARCLDSVRDLVEEIVLVDTGSADRTVEIARRYTERVFFFPWVDDFAAARNFSFDQAQMEYCMWLDADDLLLEADREEFLRLKEELEPDTDLVMLPYHTAFDEAGRPTFTYYRERLMRRAAHPRWVGAVHEAVPPAGKVRYGRAAVTHRKLHPSDPDRNLRIFQKLLAEGRELDPRQQFYYARELTYHQRDEEAASVLERFLAEGRGWIENNLDACRLLAQCYQRLGQPDLALNALLRAMTYDSPRGELCCDLGAHFLAQGLLEVAAFWYELALTRPRPDASGGFVSEDCYGYLPLIQLCVCYDRMGQHERASGYNERAALLKPQSPEVLYNRAYFQQILS